MKFLNYQGLEHLINELKTRYVQKEAGKGLSTNDLTNVLKTKLDGIATGAQVNTVNKVNSKTGNVVLTSEDIEFLSSVTGSTATNVRSIIDDIIAKDKVQDVVIGTKTTDADLHAVAKSGKYSDLIGQPTIPVITGKADKSYVDDKAAAQLIKDTEQDTEIGKKANTADLHAVAKSGKYSDLTGQPAIPDITGKADTSYVDGKLTNKVDKVAGKGLSANDFTTTLKDKLDGVEAGAQTNKIELVKRNGANVAITGKTIDIAVPTKYEDLTNDKTYQTKAEILTLIADNGKLKKEIVTSLPAVGSADDNTMYLITNTDGSGYEEWLVINNKWEKLGDTSAIDLSGYVKTSDITTISNAEINAFLNA